MVSAIDRPPCVVEYQVHPPQLCSVECQRNGDFAFAGRCCYLVSLRVCNLNTQLHMRYIVCRSNDTCRKRC
jgi:hypothetical protein